MIGKTMKSSFKDWGMSPREHGLEFPCDAYGESFFDTYFRGIFIHAEPKRIFPWLCQMRVAPYSYDWIDNLGRKSPQRLTPGLDRLEIGQKVMFIFDLIDFRQNVHLTLRLDKRLRHRFGDTIITYMIVRQKQGGSRLLVKILVNYPGGVWGEMLKYILPPGDLFMMRKQLINFKSLSEAGSAGAKDKG